MGQGYSHPSQAAGSKHERRTAERWGQPGEKHTSEPKKGKMVRTRTEVLLRMVGWIKKLGPEHLG